MLLNVKETDILFGVKCYDIVEWNSNRFVKLGQYVALVAGWQKHKAGFAGL